jgi:hypothetical protein
MVDGLRRPGRRAGDDREQREIAARIGAAFPSWLIMWGAYSREFWAYPRFNVPKGNIVHSAAPGDLAAEMRHLQARPMEGQRWMT